jgi:organic hydroperoxide reductase OsmC/OhrA
MQAFPHRYEVSAHAESSDAVVLSAEGLPPMRSETPKEFDGPGDRWSPETLLAGAVVDCFALTFRGLAKRHQLAWRTLDCHIVGTLDRVERLAQFTGFEMRAVLAVPAGTDHDRARRLLEQAEEACLVSRSLKGACHLTTEVVE